MCMYPESKEQSPYLTVFTSKIYVFYSPDWIKGGGSHENEFFKSFSRSYSLQFCHIAVLKKFNTSHLYGNIIETSRNSLV